MHKHSELGFSATDTRVHNRFWVFNRDVLRLRSAIASSKKRSYPQHEQRSREERGGAMNEPIAYINVEERKLEWATPIKWETPTIVKMDKVPLYTAPPQREWRGLTYADLYFWGNELGLGELGKGVLRAVDAHLREKNQ
jgi:hypothetical protein